ncbi:MAG: hypothetical protein KJ000_28935 [Pirellulaceae bacterium]|nr:hypothetical protein [Pirellulaceae bacterium]
MYDLASCSASISSVLKRQLDGPSESRDWKERDTHFCPFCLHVGDWVGIVIVVMDFQSGRIGETSASKPTRGCLFKSLLPMPFPLRAAGVFCGVGLEHRKQWIEDRWQTLFEGFAAIVFDVASPLGYEAGVDLS